MSKDLIKRAEVLGKSLDNGVLNLSELRAFLASVAAYDPPPARTGKKEERFLAQLMKLDKKAATAHS